MTKVTKEQVEAWIGSDNLSTDSLLKLLTELANDTYTAKEFNRDVELYEIGETK